MQVPATAALTPGRLATIVVSRFVLSSVFRVTYPLGQFLVLRTHISDQAAASLVTVQVVAGLASPLSGWFGDRYGYRRTMTWGLMLSTIGAGLVATTLNFPVLIAAFCIVGLGSAIYQPAMQAYVSEGSPLAQRGRAMGAVELSWALAGIVGVPVLALLVERMQSLAVPYGLLAALLLLIIALTRSLPDDRRAAPGAKGIGASNQPHRNLAEERTVPSIRTVLRQPSVLALLLFLWLVLCGEETLFIAQPPWLRMHLGADAVMIAQALFVFGWGELGGSLLAMLLTDRLGVRLAPVLGYCLAALSYMVLPLAGQTWTLYLICFACFALCFEFAVVSSFSLVSAVYPPARGTVLALGGTALQLGRAAGSQLGVLILPLGGSGILGNGIVAALLTLLGVGLVIAFVHPRETTIPAPATVSSHPSV